MSGGESVFKKKESRCWRFSHLRNITCRVENPIEDSKYGSDDYSDGLKLENKSMENAKRCHIMRFRLYFELTSEMTFNMPKVSLDSIPFVYSEYVSEIEKQM